MTSWVTTDPAIHLLIFDLDETLAPDDETNRIVLAEIARHLTPRVGVPPEPFFAALNDAARGEWERGPAAAYAHRIGISPIEGLWGPFAPSADPMLDALHNFVPGYRQRVWVRALTALGARDTALASVLAARFAMERAARQRSYPWSRDVLTALHGRFRLGMITNGAPDLQRQKLAGAGLADHVDQLIVSGDLGIGKPKPAIFARALALAGDVDPTAAIMIGDNWHRDILGALRAGLRALWINPTGAPLPTLDATSQSIQSIADVRALLPLLDIP